MDRAGGYAGRARRAGSLSTMRMPALLIVPCCLLVFAGCSGGPGGATGQPSQPTQQSRPAAPSDAGGISQAPTASGSPGALQTPVSGNASPAATTRPPAGAVTAAALPTGAELGGWSEGATGTGGGTEQLSVCQQNRWESTGATGIVRRSYSKGADQAAAVALSFDSPELADQAYQTTQRWFADCTATLQARGGQATQQNPAQPVPVPGGKAEATAWGWSGNQHEAQGLIQIGNRVEVLVIRAPQPFDPLQRALPNAARRLAG